jgi:hypothetical protein
LANTPGAVARLATIAPTTATHPAAPPPRLHPKRGGVGNTRQNMPMAAAVIADRSHGTRPRAVRR